MKVSAALGPDLALLAAVVADMTSDPLVFQPAGPAHTLSEFLGGISQVWRHAHRLVPLFVMHGSADKLTDPDGSEALVAHAGSRDKTFKRYDGLYHDLVHEPEKGQVFADLGAWIESRIPHE